MKRGRGRPLWARLASGIAGVLEGAGLLRGGLAPDQLLAEASHKTGLADFGDPAFREPFSVLLSSFAEEAGADRLGRLLFRSWCSDLLINRLQIQAEIQRHPEILEVPIRRPLFIVGLPRTGTTLLYNLLGAQPGARPLLLWEQRTPAPSPEPDSRATDPRINGATWFVRALLALSPGIQVAHPLNPDGPEETNGLLQNAFLCELFPFMAHLPRYRQYIESLDAVSVYRYVKQQLQLLSWKVRGDHWVLKAPVHLYHLSALLQVFPDAAIVIPHRDLRTVAASLCSLTVAFRTVFEGRVDPEVVGRYWMSELPRMERGYREARAAAPERFFDVEYQELLADPQGTVRRIHQHFGYPLSESGSEQVARWLAENPQHKHGKHRYDLATFGLDAAELDRMAAGFLARPAAVRAVDGGTAP